MFRARCARWLFIKNLELALDVEAHCCIIQYLAYYCEVCAYVHVHVYAKSVVVLLLKIQAQSAWSWRWRHNDPSKRRQILTPQNTWIFSNTAVRSSNISCYSSLRPYASQTRWQHFVLRTPFIGQGTEYDSQTLCYCFIVLLFYKYAAITIIFILFYFLNNFYLWHPVVCHLWTKHIIVILNTTVLIRQRTLPVWVSNMFRPKLRHPEALKLL
jgi:hypothetical protein